MSARIDPTKTVAAHASAAFRGRALQLDEPASSIRKYRNDANVVTMLTLRSSDAARFKKFQILLRHYDPEMAAEVLRAFDPTRKKADALDWMAENVGRLPDITLKLIKANLAAIALVAIAVGKYGIVKLNKMYDEKELDRLAEIPLHSYELRSRHQAKYRQLSKSTQKESKDVAHYAGLDVVTQLNGSLPVPHRVSSEVLRVVLNDDSNFRMVKQETNRKGGLHDKVDALFFRAHSGELVRLNKKQRQRVEQVVRFYQSELFQDTIVNHNGKYLYNKIREVVNTMDSVATDPGVLKLWNDDRDKKPLQSASVTAKLTKGKTPNRRYHETKAIDRAVLECKLECNNDSSMMHPPPGPVATPGASSSSARVEEKQGIRAPSG